MRRPGNRGFVAAAALVTLVVVALASYYASSAPDGLGRAARDSGIAGAEKSHGAADGPLAGYRAEGVRGDGLSTLVAGVTGSLVVLAIFGGLTLVLRRRKAADERAGR